MAQLHLVLVDGLELEGWNVDEHVALFDARHQRTQTIVVELELREAVFRRHVEHRIDRLLDASGRADAVAQLKVLHRLGEVRIEGLGIVVGVLCRQIAGNP